MRSECIGAIKYLALLLLTQLLFAVGSLTSEQLKGIALQNQQSKRRNTQKSYGVQDRKFQVGAVVGPLLFVRCCACIRQNQ